MLILYFPFIQFRNQEPETNKTIEETCKINHGVTFQLTEKVYLNEKNEHPVFTYLKNKKGGFLGKNIKWNFRKILLDKNGSPVKRYAPTEKPEKIEKSILNLVNN
jgi:glutathione peroxidase